MELYYYIPKMGLEMTLAINDFGVDVTLDLKGWLVHLVGARIGRLTRPQGERERETHTHTHTQTQSSNQTGGRQKFVPLFWKPP